MTKRSAAPIDLSGLSELAPELAATLAAIASDIALVVDSDGIIRNVALGAGPLNSSTDDWVGRAWVDTVTSETRRKIEQLLEEVGARGVAQRREVNHRSRSGSDIPMTYAAIRLGEDGPVLAAGRDLRAIAAIQQRFLQTQQEMEHDYWSRRQAEARYRLLFQVATDAVLVVDAETLSILDTNPAANRLLRIAPAQLAGRRFAVLVESKSRPAVDEVLRSARATGRPSEIRVRLDGQDETAFVSATPVRGDHEMLLLVRVSTLNVLADSSDADAQLSGLVDRIAEAVAVTDKGGRIIAANPVFLSMCGVSVDAQIRGRSIGEWLESVPGELSALLGEVKQRGIAARPAGSFRDGSESALAVEISVSLLTDGEDEHLGFSVRRRDVRAPSDDSSAQRLLRAVLALQEQLGSTPLPALAHDIARVVEDHLITIALERARGDAKSAAQLLGASPEEFDAQLRRLEAQAGSVVPGDAPSGTVH